MSRSGAAGRWSAANGAWRGHPAVTVIGPTSGAEMMNFWTCLPDVDDRVGASCIARKTN